MENEDLMTREEFTRRTREMLRRCLSPSGEMANGRTAPSALQDAITRKERALAELRELELQRKRGKLCDIEETCRQLEDTFAVVRERALSVPGKLADKIAMQPREVCLDLLQVEIREMLNDLSDSAAAEIARRAAEEAKGDGTS
jgi:hypothetical protein